MQHVPLHPDLVGLPKQLALRLNECQIWQGAVDNEGYPRSRPRLLASGLKTSVYVRRRRFEGRWGPLAPGERVYNLCGERRCTNPYHMGMERPNTKRRQRPASAKLNPRKVRAIRQAWTSPDRPSQNELARQHGVSRSAISLVVRDLTWQHVKPIGGTS